MDYFNFGDQDMSLDPFAFQEDKCEPVLAVQPLNSFVIPAPRTHFTQPPVALQDPVAPQPPTKKRKRSASPPSTTSDEEIDPSIAYVYLSREDLLNLSSDQLQQRVNLLEKEKPFTPEEAAEVKRQRRLIKNREYAQTSRAKKKRAMNVVKSQVVDLEKENAALQDKIRALEARVAELEKENDALRMNSFEDTLSTSSPSSTDDLMVDVIDNHFAPTATTKPDFFSKANPFGGLSSMSATVLFAVLFSFGILFNVMPIMGGMQAPVDYRTSRSLYANEMGEVGLCPSGEYYGQPLSGTSLPVPGVDLESSSSVASAAARGIVLAFGSFISQSSS